MHLPLSGMILVFTVSISMCPPLSGMILLLPAFTAMRLTLGGNFLC